MSLSHLGLSKPLFELFNIRGWPGHKALERWFKRKELPFSRRYYTEIRAGGMAPDRFPVNFIRGLLDVDELSLEYYRGLLVDHMATIGLTPTAGLGDDTIITCLCSGRPTTTAVAKRSRDLLERGVDGLWAALGFVGRARSALRTCADEASVAKAIHWMYIGAGRQLANDPDLRFDIAERTARERITLSLEQYVERAVMWWKHNPWTIIIACASGKPWGMCTALPLTETAYAAIINGEIASFELGPADFSTPTGHLLIEACAERPEGLGGDLRRARTALQVAMSAQAAALTRADMLNRNQEVCLLSFSASAKTARRLRSFGFTEIGRQMKHTNVELMERRLDYGKFVNPGNAFWHGLLLKLAQECSDMPEPIEL